MKLRVVVLYLLKFEKDKVKRFKLILHIARILKKKNKLIVLNELEKKRVS